MPIIVYPFLDAHRPAMTILYRAAWHATYDAVDGAAAIERVIAALLDGDRPEMFEMPDGDVALVAALDGRLIGGIRGHPRHGTLHLSGMYVALDQQGLGAGSALLGGLLQRFPHGIVVRADVRPTSTAAHRFYERHGFVETGRGRADVGGGHWVDMIELQRG